MCQSSFFADSILYVRTNRTIAITLSFLLFFFFSLFPIISHLVLLLLKFFTSYIVEKKNFPLAYSPMDNNPLTPRASSFSIASLITSDCCDDENSLYHSVNNSVGTTNLNFTSDSSIDKITNEYYTNHHQQQQPTLPTQHDLQQFRSATLSETNNGQYQQSTTKESRSTNHKHHHHQVTNLQKSLTTIRNMEGQLIFLRHKTPNKFDIHLSSRLYTISN